MSTGKIWMIISFVLFLYLFEECFKHFDLLASMNHAVMTEQKNGVDETNDTVLLKQLAKKGIDQKERVRTDISKESFLHFIALLILFFIRVNFWRRKRLTAG